MAGQPHRRASDRWERSARCACRTLALLGLPIAVAIAWLSHQAATSEAGRYADTLFRSEATTLEDAPKLEPVQRTPATVAAEWVGPDRALRQGTVQVPHGSEAGYELPVWTTETGELAAAPPSETQLAVDAVVLAFEIMLGVGIVAYGSFLLLQVAVDRLRSREWDRAWEAFITRQRWQ